MSWTTPTIDRLASEGIKLENYFTSYSCVPARGAFLTGRYPIRLGLWEAGEGAELPLEETTIAQELQSAGYRTYIVGKWHMGFSTPEHTPTYRGFDSSYTFWNGAIDYWNKTYSGYLDLHSGVDLVTDEDEISPSLHNGYLMQTKAEVAITDHAENYADQPMFLYYAMQLIHGDWTAPDVFKDRCGVPSGGWS
jgi:arylsulfatase A-like enzyme